MSSAEQKIYYTEEDYYNLPDDVRAEIIDGEIYYSASPNRIHQEISMQLSRIIAGHIHINNSSCRIYAAPFDVKLYEDKDTIVVPDISVICDHNKLTDRGCTGAPDWIIEIVSPSNPGHDYVRKLNLYRDAGVKEYWIIDPIEEGILVYQFKDLEIKTGIYTFQDKIKAGIFDDLEIDFQEISKRLG